MKITFVKKILEDGSPCQKCADVQQKLETAGQLKHINETLYADVRDIQSPGMVLSKKYDVDRAPFFIVDHEDGTDVTVYTVYMKFVKDVLQQAIKEKDELKEIMENNDLDFL